MVKGDKFPISFVPYNVYMGTVQENDTAIHDFSLAAFVPLDTVAIIFKQGQVSGSGVLYLYPNEGSYYAQAVDHTPQVIGIVVGSQNLKWKNSIANDEWEFYLLGYFRRITPLESDRQK